MWPRRPAGSGPRGPETTCRSGTSEAGARGCRPTGSRSCVRTRSVCRAAERYSTPAPGRAASAIGGVPASNFWAPRSSSARREVDRADHLAAGQERLHRLEEFAPGPRGPRYLSARAPCGQTRRRSPQPIDWTSTGMCGTACAPSMSDTAPAARCARPSRDGIDRAESFETWVKATSFHRRVPGAHRAAGTAARHGHRPRGSEARRRAPGRASARERCSRGAPSR